MPPTGLESPVTEILATVLESICSEDVVCRRPERGDEEIAVLSYRIDFSYLWELSTADPKGLLNWVLSGVNNPRSIVLVWDGLPEFGEVTKTDSDIDRYVTPIDWIVAFTGRIFSKLLDARVSKPQLRVFVLDLKSQEYDTAFGCRQIDTVRMKLQWVQFYRPVQKNRAITEVLHQSLETTLLALVRSNIPPEGFGFETLLKDILDLSRVRSLKDAHEAQDLSATLESLLGLWRNNLAGAKTRHTVANLLAPMLLVKGLPSNIRGAAEQLIVNDQPLRSSLRELMDAVGLLASEELNPLPSPQGLLRQMCDENDIFGRRKYIKFLLVDDQYGVGYQHIIAYLLFGEQYTGQSQKAKKSSEWFFALPEHGELRCESSVNVLISALKVAPDDGKWHVARTLEFLDCHILLLDLRLWTDDRDRNEVLRQLLGVCDKLKALPSENADGLFLDSAFIKAYLSAKNLVEGNGQFSEIEALALLPLLLSYCDPSLPIILFSSTHQRTLVEMVSHRHNIITDFTKPILSGYGEYDDGTQLVNNLHKALEKAVRLYETSFMWKMLKGISWSDPLPIFAVGKFGVKGLTKYNDGPNSQYKQPPRIKGDELEGRLAGYYRDYIQTGNYYDFCTLCWELLEGSFIPDDFLNKAEPPQFVLYWFDDKRNYIARLAYDMRNKKSHGSFRMPVVTERQRLATILSFAMFLDYIKREDSNYGGNLTEEEDLLAHLKSKYPFITLSSKPNGELEPEAFTHSPHIEDADFIAYAACYYANRSFEGRKRYISQNTTDAIRAFAKYIMLKPPDVPLRTSA